MNTSFWTLYISDGTIKAICWTLIHSLWIGLIIALLCGIIVAATRKSAAALRYRLLCGLLVLFVCAIGVTYYLEASSAPVYNAVEHAQNILVKAPAYAVANPTIARQNQTFLDNVEAFLNQNVNIIFLIWLLFFMLKSLKMVSGLLYIQRIRHYKTSAVTEELKHRLSLFSSQIGIRRAVRLVQSELVKVPVAVGWLKPMILLPVGIVFQLTPEQLDGILWHELAHIRRRDYLVNILQGIVETVFFFNPGLLWLSSLIRTEREACCDDMVLSRMNRKANYLEALLSFGYGEFSQARYAMSIGSGNQLRDRLKRMISQENKRLSVAEKSVLAMGLVLLTAFTTISKDNAVVKDLTIRFTNKSSRVITKTMPVSMRRLPEGPRVNDSKSGAVEKHAIVLTDTAIRFTSVLFKHSDADWANNDISAKDDKGNVYHFIVADGKITSMELNDIKVEENKLPDYEYTLQLIVSELMEKRRIRQEDAAGYKAMEPQARLDAIKLGQLKDSLKAMKLPLAKYSADALPKPKMKGMKIQQRMHDDSVDYATAFKKMMKIIGDLVKDKVVANSADVKWFGLSDTEFIVNGQKLSNEMQQRFKAKYGVHEGYGLYYGPAPMKGRGAFIDPDGMAKALRLNDSIRSARFKARPGTDDERRALKLQMMHQRPHDDSIGYLAQRQRALNVIADLVTDKVVPDAASVKWFGLSNTEFIVNGQKQPYEMQQRYKAKFGVYDGYGLYYGPVQMHGIGVFIDLSDTRYPRPPHPERPRPKYMGDVMPNSRDSILWKNQQLIRQQQRFAADQAEKREKLLQQQQAFATEQNEKRAQLLQQQQALLTEQNERMKRQHWLEHDIDLQPAISGVIADLVSANIISDKSGLSSFNLSNKALIVNGKIQAEDIHEKLKSKYLDRSAYPGNFDGMDWNRIKDDPNFGLHFDTNGGEGLGIIGKRYSQ